MLLVRCDDDRHARVRMFPQMHHRNAADVLHGGTILGLIDTGMFAGASLLKEDGIGRGVTVEVSTHFLGAGDPERPLDCVVEVAKETGRMVFTRGMVVQGEDAVASFTGILRKLTPNP